MVINIRSKKSNLAAGLAGLNAGIPRGFSMGQEAQRTQLAQEHYKSQVALANQAATLDAQREQRYADEQNRNNKLQDDQREGMRTLTNERIDSITPEQTAPGYVAGGGLKQAGSAGMMAPSKFAIGLMQHHDRVLSHAKEVAKRLDTALHEQFWTDVQNKLQSDQQNAMMSKAQSDLETLGRDVVTPEVGGAVADLVPEVQERAKGLKDLLQTAQDPNLKPEQRAKILAEVQNGIHSQRADLKAVGRRRKTTAALVQNFQPKIDKLRMQAAEMDDPEMAATLMARADEKQDILDSAGLDPDMDTDRLLERWHQAGTTTVPRSSRGRGTEGGGGGQRGAWSQKDLYEAAVKSLQPEFMDTGAAGEQIPKAIPIERVRTRMREIENGQDITPDIVPMGSVPSTTSQTAKTPAIEVPQEVQQGAQEMYVKARETMSVEEAKKAIEAWIRTQVAPIKDTGNGVEASGSLIRLRGKQPVQKPKKKEPVRTGAGEDYMRDPNVRAALATKPKPRE